MTIKFSPQIKEYLHSIDDEILEDVYFYHHQINDKIDMYSIGCELSEWDGEKIASLINTKTNENIILLNTCAVTHLAQMASERIAKKLSILYPNKKMYITGCGVGYNQEYYDQFGTTILNKDKFSVKHYNCSEKNTEYSFNMNTHREAGTVKIEDGCFNNCSYCIIHKLRPHFMVPYENIKKQITNLLKQGKTTIQLIGTEITSYNYNNMDLTELCKTILKDFPNLEYLVLGALDPASKQIDSLIELIKQEPRLANSLYLCTQSCSDTILKAMRRRHDVNRLREINKLAGEDVQLIFQLIIGFPGETDELFQETLDLIKELKPADYDTLRFSARKGTDAYNMPNQIPEEIAEKREYIIYETIKEYTKNMNTTNVTHTRTLTYFEKTNFDKFNMFRPNLDNLNKYIIFYEDLYNNDSLIKLFNTLSTSAYLQTDKEIVIITNLDLNKDKNELDINIKLLVTTFGVKVITKININDELINIMRTNPTKFNFNFSNFSYRLLTYLQFEFEKLDPTKTEDEDILKLFTIINENKLEDINNVVRKFISAGNISLAKIFFYNPGFNITL